MAELKKTLGFWMIAAIAFLNLVNTGIFFGLGLGAKAGGLNSIIAWLILAVLSIYMAMCFGELTAMFPRAGGVYEFAKQAYGRFTSFLIGWIVWVSGNIATALFTVAAINLLVPNAPLALGPLVISASVFKILLSILVVLLLNYIAYRGIDASARMMILLSLFMLCVFAAILIPGFGAVDPANLSGFSMNVGMILLAAFFLSETFFGWESVSFMSEETEDAERVIPRALITTTTFVAGIAILIALITIGALGIEVVQTADKPILLLLSHLQFSAQALMLINIGIIVTLLGNASGNIVSLPRLLLALSRDKLFIEQFSDIHEKRQTPHKAILFQTIIVVLIVIIAAGTYET
jgi:basic amino acid/polyamine antiporter, APA family